MMRVDVFSAKGGVGKTTVAYRLAKKWADESKQPVLLVDADLSGTCLGDLVESTAAPGWRDRPNLIHLVCGRPEELPELLDPNLWPIYELRVTPDEKPLRGRASISGAQVLFCPSHAETYFEVPGGKAPVDLAVLQALLGHESAGGWVGHVIESVINVVDKKDVKGVGRLAGTVVDHGPGIGALQWSQMSAINAELANATKDGRLSQRQALFVITRDLVDLAAAQAINERIVSDRKHPWKALRANATWVLNRVPQKWAPASKERPDAWRTSLQELLKDSGMGPGPRDEWFYRALPLFEETLLGDAYAISGLAAYFEQKNDGDIQKVYERVITNDFPKAAP
jgi:hypothetical protein